MIDSIILAFKRGVADALIEQGMAHAEEYLNHWKYYEDGYAFGEYLHHLMTVDDVEVMRE
jgi:hypothetical protein|tara:strand:- start:1218 stop:1397 length:180 start_codon:yes stop_codon:yes gene_type:complete